MATKLHIHDIVHVTIRCTSLSQLTFFSIKLMHSSSLARVATKESLVTESVEEFSLLPTRSSSVK